MDTIKQMIVYYNRSIKIKTFRFKKLLFWKL